MDVVDVYSIAAVEAGEDGDGGESCLISASLGLVSCSMTVEDLFFVGFLVRYNINKIRLWSNSKILFHVKP